MASEQLKSLLGNELLNKNEKVSIDSLAGKHIGLYFSAHWCGPCRGFTPKLAQAYTSALKGKNFEIIFVSSDRDEASFTSYYAEMPWLALPFSDRDRKQALSRKYKVQGIPSLVILSPEGELITRDGREGVGSDPQGKNFPWPPKTFWETLGNSFQRHEGTPVTVDELKQGYFGLYFSASWCPPCQGFTPKLVDVYNKLKQDGKKFEVVFVSSDQDEEGFNGYYKKMPWLTVPFEDREREQELSRFFEIEGIPSLVIVDGTTGKVVNPNGVEAVRADPTGAEFPWLPKPFYDLSEDASEINDLPSLVVILTGCSDEEKKRVVEKAVAPVASMYFQEANSSGEKKYAFYTAKSKEGVVERIFQLCDVKTETSPAATMMLLDVGAGGVYYNSDADVTAEGIAEFLAAYEAKTLTPQKFSR